MKTTYFLRQKFNEKGGIVLHFCKSDLIEERTENFGERAGMQKKNDIMSDIVVKMRTDPNFCSLVESLYNRNDSEIIGLMKTLLSLDEEKINGVKQMLSAFLK